MSRGYCKIERERKYPDIAYDKTLSDKYKGYFKRAFDKKMQFELSPIDFNSLTENVTCVYCGKVGNLGIDRIDSSIGYTHTNCQSCCGTCNLMKKSHNEQDFLNHILSILKYKGII